MKRTRFFERCSHSYQYLTQMCARITEEYPDITFSVAQCDPNFQSPMQIINLVKDISDFYNENWLGNSDYIHIPDARKVLDNYLKYPIIMAYKTNADGEIEILGISTLKYYQNTDTCINPYYPIPNARFFEVTGILTKQNSEEKNIGKKIYEIIIEALEKYQSVMPDFDVIFVADCRNYMSINGARGGAHYIRNLGKNAYAKIIGFYTVRENGTLVEAPTFIAKFSFDDYYSGSKIEFAYEDTDDLFESMLEKIRCNLDKFHINEAIYNNDETSEVAFYKLDDDSINLDDITILPNGTEKGNDRIPWPVTRKRSKVGASNV